MILSSDLAFIKSITSVSSIFFYFNDDLIIADLFLFISSEFISESMVFLVVFFFSKSLISYF